MLVKKTFAEVNHAVNNACARLKSLRQDDLSAKAHFGAPDADGCVTVKITVNWSGLKVWVTVEEVEKGEWNAFLPTDALSPFMGGNALADSVEEVDDLITLLRQARNFLSLLQQELTR
jgi:hypothetical protein